MKRKVVIAGGGTGGHLFPGIALAKALKRNDMTTEIEFVGTKQGIESKILPEEGFKLRTIVSSGLLGKKGLARWVSLFKLPIGTVESIWFLFSNRPNLVVGVGGYASFPLVFSAWLLRIPILIHEQNAFPGMANKWLGKIADKVAISYKESKQFFPKNKVEVTGNMVHEKLCQPREDFPYPLKEPFWVLILGGSQGAHSINMAMIKALDPRQVMQIMKLLKKNILRRVSQPMSCHFWLICLRDTGLHLLLYVGLARQLLLKLLPLEELRYLYLFHMQLIIIKNITLELLKQPMLGK